MRNHRNYHSLTHYHKLLNLVLTSDQHGITWKCYMEAMPMTRKCVHLLNNYVCGWCSVYRALALPLQGAHRRACLGMRLMDIVTNQIQTVITLLFVFTKDWQGYMIVTVYVYAIWKQVHERFASTQLSVYPPYARFLFQWACTVWNRWPGLKMAFYEV